MCPRTLFTYAPCLSSLWALPNQSTYKAGPPDLAEASVLSITISKTFTPCWKLILDVDADRRLRVEVFRIASDKGILRR